MQRMALPHPKSRSLGFLGASMPQRGPSGGDPCWPPEAIPAPAVQLVEEELRELVRSDIHRFGVVTHQRAPDPACPFPPRCSKRTDVRLHSAYRPEEAHPWDHLQPPGGLTPRFDKRSSTSRDPKPVETVSALGVSMCYRGRNFGGKSLESLKKSANGGANIRERTQTRSAHKGNLRKQELHLKSEQRIQHKTANEEHRYSIYRRISR